MELDTFAGESTMCDTSATEGMEFDTFGTEYSFDIKAFERRHRRSYFSAVEIIEAYNGVNPSLDKFMRVLSACPSPRAEKKPSDDNEHLICSVLIDRSPVMRAGWPDLLQCVNRMDNKIKNTTVN